MGLIAACERASDHVLRLEGLQRKGIASHTLGDIWTSIDSLEEILRARPPATPSLEAVVHRNLGTGYSFMRNRQEMERHFRAAFAGHRALGESDEATKDLFDFADALARFDDFAAAVNELNDMEGFIAETANPELDKRWNGARVLLERLRHTTGDGPA